MNFAEALKQQATPTADRAAIPPGVLGACKVCRILDELGDDARETLQHYIEAEGFGETRITKALTTMGYPVGSKTVARHLSQKHR